MVISPPWIHLIRVVVHFRPWMHSSRAFPHPRQILGLALNLGAVAEGAPPCAGEDVRVHFCMSPEPVPISPHETHCSRHSSKFRHRLIVSVDNSQIILSLNRRLSVKSERHCALGRAQAHRDR
jgi:hypothetical protein